MAEMAQIHEFAHKWIDKFKDKDISYIELVDHYMADDCAALGFEMDCGHAFSEKYGNAANNYEALESIIDQVTDIPLLGSAIYSQWRYFNHWSYSGEEILDSKNRSWFITALSRLATLADESKESDCKIILFPEYVTLKADVEKLRTEISMLLLEKDELRLVICKNIETAYMLALGGMEYKVYEFHCNVLRLKRKIDLIQAKKNRQEKIVVTDIDTILDKEFADYQRQLEEQIIKMNKALDHSKGRPLTDQEIKEIKKTYRSIVKALHPDLHPDVTPAQIQLFQNAVQAYENGDLNCLRVICDMVADPVLPEQSESGLTLLTREKDRLIESMKLIREQIEQIKSEYPYTMKDLVEDPEKIAEKKSELEDAIENLKKSYHFYNTRLREMLG